MCLGNEYQSSTKASSRVFLNAGTETSATKIKARNKRLADNGLVTNTVKSPLDSNKARRKFSSIIGPRTKPNNSGGASHSNLLNKYPIIPNAAVR